MKNNASKRNTSLDLIRSIAIACVVLNHCSEGIYPLTTEQFYGFSFKSQLFGIGSFTLGRMGVPLFLMLTGYLLLPREYDSERIRRFYKHNLIPMIIVWEIWILIYQVFMCAYLKEPFVLIDFILRVLLLKNAGLAHTWYMPTIIGIYLFLPFVSTALKKCENRILFSLMSISFIYIFVIHSITIFMNALQAVPSSIPSTKIDLSFGGSEYAFYVIVGYCIARFKDRIIRFIKPRRLLFAVFSAVLFSLTVYAQVYLRTLNYTYLVWYDFCTLPLCGFCLFCLFYGVELKARISSFLKELSSCSFGIFLVHEPLLLSIRSRLTSSSTAMTVLMQWIAVYILSLVTVYVLTRIRGIRKLFLYK